MFKYYIKTSNQRLGTKLNNWIIMMKDRLTTINIFTNYFEHFLLQCSFYIKRRKFPS